MRDADFEIFRDYMKKSSGLVLTPDKVYLLESRLLPVAKENGFSDLADLAVIIKQGTDAKIMKQVTEAMATHESSFMRDGKPYERFEKIILPQIMENNAASKKIRIWSAACSSGQEPYSLAMLMKEIGAKLDGWRIDIFATDISDHILDKARDGTFTQFEIQRGLPIQYLVKYFEQNGEQWRIKQDVKSMVRFQNLNLLSNIAHIGEFDVVFLRNVLIYFDVPTKAEVLQKVRDVTDDKGFLVLGGAETVMGISEKWKLLKGHNGLYLPADGNFEALEQKCAGISI